ncbi:MAG TPA: ABC transporter substrate-binding protein, partial [Gammaproteobacteria bacterium]|nr:ABC transporter substrate-binding protein [Gammaproteobacteria bacterium]
DPREAFFYAAHYLFGSADNLTTTQIDQIELLLRNQKQWVEAYTNDKMAYMLEAGILPLVITPAANFLKTLPLDGDYGFYVPLSGNLFVIETVAIPALSKKTEAAHACINFLISKDSALAGSKKYCYNPVISAVYAELEPEIAERLQAFASPERIAGMYLLRNDISLKRLETLWISVKSA